MADEIAKVAETEKAPDAAVDVKVLADQLEQIKKAQAGSDKAYQAAEARAKALDEELEKLKKEKMTDKELATFELAKEKAEVEKSKREVADATLRLAKIKLLGAKNIPVDFSEYISGGSEQELTANLDTFLKLFDAEVGKRVNEKLVGNEKPKAGAEAEKSTDFTTSSLKDLNRLAAEGKLKL
jgi:DNA repair exonuclease SbcCD ATPase subunit